MSSNVVLQASKREFTGKRVRALRQQGQLPAVIYGAGIEATPIALDLRSTTKEMRSITSATIVTVNVDGEEYNALVRERQYDRIKRELIHIDFLAVAMNVLLRANVPLRLIGVAPAVKDYGAVIYQDRESLDVEALPRNLPEFIEVDISTLKEIGSHISVSDLTLSADVEILDEPNAVIAAAIASAASIEEEAEAAAAAEAAAEPELVERKRDEDDFED